MIPSEKQEAVERALRDVWGTTVVDEAERITRGRTNSLVFRVVVRGTPYLLKIIGRQEDPTRHYACMRAAAEAGLAPRVIYTHAGDRLSLTDFVRAERVSRSAALPLLGRCLRELHALAPFARAPFNTTCTFLLTPGPAREGFVASAAKLLPEEERERLLAGYEELVTTYSTREEDLVACHNDLFKPDNMLFAGRKLWLVDWEAACLNDRYAELAVVANQVVANAEDEEALLREYFGGAPSEEQRSRLRQMQRLARVFYALAFTAAAAAKGTTKASAPLPDLDDYQRQWWEGEVAPVDGESKMTYARVQLAHLLQ